MLFNTDIAMKTTVPEFLLFLCENNIEYKSLYISCVYIHENRI